MVRHGNCQVNWIRSPVWVPPRSEKAQIIAAYELAPTKLIATDGKFSELSINLSIPAAEIQIPRFSPEIPRHPRRRLQHLQYSTSPDPPIDASPLSSRSRLRVGGSNCGGMNDHAGVACSRLLGVNLSIPL
jgi:hypothetical protein